MLVRESFEKELQRLKDDVLRMGSEIEENLPRSVSALMKRNLQISQQIIDEDKWVNELHLKIVMESLTTIATQQPMAGDMRLLAAIMGIANELERIHDYIKGIGKINLMIGNGNIPQGLLTELPDMAEKARDMMHQALRAFSERNAALAKEIPNRDDEIDALYNQTYKKLTTYISQNPSSVEEMHRLDWANHNIERSADRVGNICEWVVYMVTGKYEEMVD